jgi:hypothetical protein
VSRRIVAWWPGAAVDVFLQPSPRAAPTPLRLKLHAFFESLYHLFSRNEPESRGGLLIPAVTVIPAITFILAVVVIVGIFILVTLVLILIAVAMLTTSPHPSVTSWQ